MHSGESPFSVDKEQEASSQIMLVNHKAGYRTINSWCWRWLRLDWMCYDPDNCAGFAEGAGPARESIAMLSFPPAADTSEDARQDGKHVCTTD